MIDHEKLDGDTLHTVKEYVSEQLHELVDSLMIGLNYEDEALVRMQLTEEVRFWKRAPGEGSITKLAKAFSAILLDWLGPEKMQEVIDKNYFYMDEASNCCASHEYCDANQAMIDAMKDLGYGEWTLSLNVTGHLIERAWDLAKVNDFYFTV